MILGMDDSDKVFFTAFSPQAEEKFIGVATEMGKDFKHAAISISEAANSISEAANSISGAANSISGAANEIRDMFFFLKWTTIVCVAAAVPFGMYCVLSSSRTKR